MFAIAKCVELPRAPLRLKRSSLRCTMSSSVFLVAECDSSCRPTWRILRSDCVRVSVRYYLSFSVPLVSLFRPMALAIMEPPPGA